MLEAGEIFGNELDGDPAGEVFEDDLEGDPVGESVIIDSLEDVEFTLGPVFLIEGGSTSVSDSGNNALRSVEDTGADFSVVGEESLEGLSGVGVEGVAVVDGGSPVDVKADGDS